MTRNAIFLKKKKPGGSFSAGFKSPFRALGTLFENKGMIKFVIIPFFINIILLGLVFYFTFSFVYHPLFNLISGDSWYLKLLQKMLAPVLVLILGIIIVLIYSILGSIVAAPFNELLTQRVEEARSSSLHQEKFRLSQILKDAAWTAKNIFKLLLFLAGVNILLLLLNLIPAVGSLFYSVIGFFSTAFFLGAQFFDYPLDRRHFEFSEKIRITWKSKSMVLGLGTAFFIITFIPIIGFLGLSISAVGATELFIDHVKPALIPERAAGKVPARKEE